MLQLGEVAVIDGSSLGFGLVVRVGHVADQEVQEGVFGLVGEFSVSIAPLAVVFVEAAVVFAADHGVVGQGHATALTVKGLRGAQKGVDRDAEFTGKDFEQLGVGLRHARFPAADGLPGDIDTFRHLFLRQIVLFAQIP